MQSFDVVILGAGLSGIGAAYHLQTRCPGRSFVLLEAREALGGTWDLFRYPGVRSDSDMHTLGYAFKPWADRKAIADGASILGYLNETATENGIDKHIRYGLRVTRATWSTQDVRWTVEARDRTGGTVDFQCNFLWICSGYYRYEKGYTPQFPGQERFQGQFIHPQFWPKDLEVRDKRIVVIGSGATAATLVPALARDAAQVVMLQRSPTYYMASPDVDVVANLLQRLLPRRLAYTLVRWKNVWLQLLLYRLALRRPQMIRRFLLGQVRKALGASAPVDPHFTPRYNPWQQRLCLVPNNDLFQAIRAGKVLMVTDEIATFTETGLQTKSGQQIQADIVVTATGLELLLFGGLEVVVDGNRVDFSQGYGYKGMMASDVPNFAFTMGYLNASWTLRADLTSQWVCKLLNHMQSRGFRQCTPRLRAQDRDMTTKPWIEGFSSGYLQRAQDILPRQGDREPWNNSQDYLQDKKKLLRAPLEDGALIFENPVPAVSPKSV